MKLVNKTIRGIDLDLYRFALASAVKVGKTIGTWINEAIAEKLKREERKTKS